MASSASQPRLMSGQGSQMIGSNQSVQQKASRRTSGHRLRKQSSSVTRGITCYSGPPEILLKVTVAFQAFDSEQSNFVNIREVGPIVRSLGLCPTEYEMGEIIRDIEDEEVRGRTPQEMFVPYVAQLVYENRYPTCPTDILLEAMKVLDVNKKGYLTKQEMLMYLTTRGEPFTAEETAEAMRMMDRKGTGKVDYFDYVSELSHDLDKNLHAT